MLCFCPNVNVASLWSHSQVQTSQADSETAFGSLCCEIIIMLWLVKQVLGRWIALGKCRLYISNVLAVGLLSATCCTCLIAIQEGFARCQICDHQHVEHKESHDEIMWMALHFLYFNVQSFIQLYPDGCCENRVLFVSVLSVFFILLFCHCLTSGRCFLIISPFIASVFQCHCP